VAFPVSLTIYSQEKRMERYRIIYTWKILEGIASNLETKTYTSTRQGSLCRVPLGAIRKREPSN